MLDQTKHWMEIAATAAAVLLLGRVLMLRLQRIYVLITLGCVIEVFFDAVGLWLGDSQESFRVFIYSRFLYAFLLPFVAWDALEEMKGQITKLRRIALARLISGLIFATVFGFLVSLLGENSDSGGNAPVFFTVAFILWAGSSTASFAFLWTMQRGIRAQNLERPNNTTVWMVFWQLFLVSQILACFANLMLAAVPSLRTTAASVMDLVFNMYAIVITAWCILRLRAVPSDVTSESANAKL
jgi:hypothetical protein